ncbi:MAG: DUF4143 domain-containing protein [bacterium]|nr:DUF4143 domain-containing protein [bacterium]MXX64998.1 ATP-binding protein [Acidimicrobiia bacterium]MCY3580632.1 DUF4143 domain-containing protein [bacterium]MCY3651590.1 DUF4143 domain-containing protein [bacterium]MDE0643342.1 DUF4143 domain-containing protein [bacterium]
MSPNSLTPDGYLPRIADGQMRSALETMPAVLIEGPRACGKTWTGRRFAASALFLDERVDDVLSAGMDPGGILFGDAPRLLDEWQLAPRIWNPMRRACDERAMPGQFILTGSANPPDDITRHTGAGRIIRVRMSPMSLYESGDSSGAISFGGLMQGDNIPAREETHSLDKVMGLACRGGWPQHIGSNVTVAGRAARAYLSEITRTDISRVDGVERNPLKVEKLLISLARNVATEVRVATLASDIAASGGNNHLERRTLARYLNALERLFVLQKVPAWSPHLASRVQIRQAPKLSLVDPSLTVAALDATPESLIRDLPFAGRLFESMAIRDLSVYAAAHGAGLSHYRDSVGLEVDLVINLKAGRWAAVEIKLGGRAGIEQGARALLRLRDKIDQEVHGPPARLIVLTATGYAFERPDGVGVVPITALVP